MRALVFAWLIASMTLCVGCHKADPLNRQAVSGKITLDGEPLTSGSIEFSPVDKGTLSGATIDNGIYAIPKEKGLSPGAYIIRISAANNDAEPIGLPGESNKIAPELVPAKYNVDSDLEFTVKADSENTFNLDIKTDQ